MRVGDSFGKVIQILEAVLAGTEAKGGLPRIDGIGAVRESIFHPGQVPGRSKEFRLFHQTYHLKPARR